MGIQCLYLISDQNVRKLCKTHMYCGTLQFIRDITKNLGHIQESKAGQIRIDLFFHRYSLETGRITQLFFHPVFDYSSFHIWAEPFYKWVS